jgi:hypothetical protein
MRQFRRGDIADSRFIFIDVNTEEPIDVLNASYTICHFVNNVKTVDVVSTPLVHISTGEYTSNWTIPDTVPENETYYVTATGTHPVDTTICEIEDSYMVVPASIYSDMVVKFVKD